MRNFYTALICCLTLQATAQAVRLSPAGQPDEPIDQSTKRQIVKRMNERIKENYYERENWQPIVDHLASLSKTEAYQEANTTQTFSRYLTITLRTFTKDPHFNVLYNPPLFKQAEGFENAPPPSSSGRPQRSPEDDPNSKDNFFMPKVEVLEGNVGYLKIQQMADIQTAKGTLHAALNFLAYTEAMIIDVRGNRGGVGGFTPYLASHFFPAEEKLLFSRELPAYDSASHFYVEPELIAPRFVEQPLYILIDAGTGSAARNLAYTMQKHGRAKLIGVPTGVGTAGGHSAGIFALQEGFVATVPIANVVHPVTKSNWSMVGVVPDVETKDSQTLNKAHQLALTDLISGASKNEKEALQAIIDRLEKESQPKKSTKSSDYEAYTGDYEMRKVFVDDGKLFLQRDGGPALELIPIEKDLFDMILPNRSGPGPQLPDVKFERDDKGEITQFSFINANGEVENTVKKL